MVGGDGGEYDVQLNLVPLIDILCNILFFLLMGFVSQEIKYEGDLPLPQADAEDVSEPTIALSLSPEVLKLNEQEIMPTSAFAKSGDVLTPLLEALKKERAAITASKELEKLETGKEAEEEKSEAVYVFADKNVPYELLSPVLRTAAMAGFPRFKLAVVSE